MFVDSAATIAIVVGLLLRITTFNDLLLRSPKKTAKPLRVQQEEGDYGKPN